MSCNQNQNHDKHQSKEGLLFNKKVHTCACWTTQDRMQQDLNSHKAYVIMFGRTNLSLTKSAVYWISLYTKNAVQRMLSVTHNSIWIVVWLHSVSFLFLATCKNFFRVKNISKNWLHYISNVYKFIHVQYSSIWMAIFHFQGS